MQTRAGRTPCNPFLCAQTWSVGRPGCPSWLVVVSIEETGLHRKLSDGARACISHCHCAVGFESSVGDLPGLGIVPLGPAVALLVLLRRAFGLTGTLARLACAHAGAPVLQAGLSNKPPCARQLSALVSFPVLCPVLSGFCLTAGGLVFVFQGARASVT